MEKGSFDPGSVRLLKKAGRLAKCTGKDEWSGVGAGGVKAGRGFLSEMCISWLSTVRKYCIV